MQMKRLETIELDLESSDQWNWRPTTIVAVTVMRIALWGVAGATGTALAFAIYAPAGTVLGLLTLGLIGGHLLGGALMLVARQMVSGSSKWRRPLTDSEARAGRQRHNGQREAR